MKLTGQRNQCPTCNRFFNSNAAFDKHRIGVFGATEPDLERRCIDPAAIGMQINKKGFWVTKLREWEVTA